LAPLPDWLAGSAGLESAMQVVIRPTPDEALWLAARVIAKAIQQKPHCTLGLATGRTMEGLYALLVKMHREEKLDFSLCKTFNLDEYIGLPLEDENSYRFYMNKHLFRHVNIDMRNTHLPDGMASDTAAACRQYEDLIRENGGIDLQLLGIGNDGHIGFNEPLSALLSRTREKALTPVTIRDNSTLFSDPSRMPKRAITMGVGTILEGRRLLLVVTSKAKAAVLAKAVEGPITAMISASAVQLHAQCTVICSSEAAGCLKEIEYYNWIFENEPEWAEYR
jgi:glucosamine-6-phosphate deaminase